MIEKDGFVFASAEEMAALDREAVERYGIEVGALMENAGSAVALLAGRVMGVVRGRKVAVLVGKGNNGGDGLVAARRLAVRGAKVCVALGCERGELREAPARQMRAVDALGIEVGGFVKADLTVDALLGYNSKGDPRGRVAELISEANAAGVPILAVDIPSGLDGTTGVAYNPCVRAKFTVTFGLPKVGFLQPGGRATVGELYCADISLPGSLGPWDKSGEGDLVRVW